MSFFTPESRLPSGSGFALFSPTHLLFLAGCALCAGALVWFSGALGRRGRVRLCRGTAVLMCLTVAAVAGYLFLAEGFSPASLPLQLCQLAPFLCLLYALTEWDWAGQTVYCICLPGAAAALLFPNWNRYPVWSFMNLQGFLLHTLLIAYPLLELRRGALKPRMGRVWKAWAFLAVVSPLIWLFNRRYGTNFFFLNAGSPNSPLTVLIAWLGNPGFLWGYAALAVLVPLAMYLPFLHRKNA